MISATSELGFQTGCPEATSPRVDIQSNDSRELRAVLETSGALAAHVDRDGRILQATDSTAKLLSYPKEHLLNSSLADVVSPEHRDVFLGLLRDAWASSSDEHARLKFSGGLTETRWLEITIRPYSTLEGGARFIVFGYDVTNWVRAEQSLKEESMLDPLTGLGNRALMRQEITEHIASAARSQNQFAVALLDLDGFKKINDTLGHDVGDALLCEVAERLKGSVRANDTVARMGGDEFVLLLAGIGSEEAASAIAERVISNLRKPFFMSGNQLRVTTSLGLTFSSSNEGLTESTLLKRADLAMYEAKGQGKNRFSVYTPDLERRQEEQFAIEQHMFDAVQKGEFVLHYQPIFDPKTSAVCGLEALMRWTREDGQIPPTKFIPLAEHNGLINLLGDWALRCACAQLARWDAQGIRVGYVSVNVSPVQFRHPGFSESVARAIEVSGIEASRIVLEITEGALMTDPEHAGRLLAELREIGVRFAVDDFGTGYSSLAYLQRFQLSALKIDRSFVADMLESKHGRSIVFAVLSLSRELGLISIAEGVETVAQCELLAQHGCDYAQGWLLAPALSVEDLETKINSGELKLPMTTAI
jgi:diguanylate cyclase (GGDEF)-like protein/PAS domain S-box-containing protein